MAAQVSQHSMPGQQFTEYGCTARDWRPTPFNLLIQFHLKALKYKDSTIAVC